MHWTPNQLCCHTAGFVIDNSKGHTIISAHKSLTCSSDVNINTVINEVTLPQVIDPHWASLFPDVLSESFISHLWYVRSSPVALQWSLLLLRMKPSLSAVPPCYYALFWSGLCLMCAVNHRWEKLVISCLPLVGVMGEYEPKIEVHFPDSVPAAKESAVKLECFALGK